MPATLRSASRMRVSCAVAPMLLAAGCGVGLPASPVRLSPTSSFLVGVEFEELGEVRSRRLCIQFVPRDKRAFYDTSPEPSGAGFGDIGPDMLALDIAFDWDGDVVDFTLVQPTPDGVAPIIRRSVTLSSLSDDEPSEDSFPFDLNGNAYRLFVSDVLDEEACRAMTNL